MRDATPQEQPWSFHSPLGTLRSKALSGQVDIAQPQLGLHQIERHGALDGSICGVEAELGSSSRIVAWPARLTEAYVRGCDLIASYHAADGWPFAPHLYWRYEPPEVAPDTLGGLSLLVSVSTHLLDTCPRIRIVSHLDVEEVMYFSSSTKGRLHEHKLTNRIESVLAAKSGVCCLLRRLRGGQFSYAEMMPADDFCRLFVYQDDDRHCLAHWGLFAEFLEKGVIRRARMQAAFLPRDADIELANACCQTMSSRPLPLTT